jgi:adenine deaminase
MAVADRDGTGTLPLECAGLMSALPAGEVSAMLDSLNGRAARLGSIGDPFMYLSFLALPVIPCLRLTARGLYDVDAPGRVDLFTP